MRRLFYLYERSGYYFVRFNDPKTGVMTTAKSTHKKNEDEAKAVVYEWLQHGIPDAHMNCRNNQSETSVTTVDNAINLKNVLRLTETLSEEQAKRLFLQLSQKYSNSVLVSSTTLSDDNSRKTAGELSKCIGERKLCEWLMEFWTAETSKYVRDRRAHGMPCTERHCYDMRGIITRYWIPFFGDTTLIKEIDQDALEDFFMNLKIEQKLAGATVNKAINAGSVAFKFAVSHKWLFDNAMQGIMRFTPDEAKRGILEDEEVAAIFKVKWDNDVHRLASLLSAFCGLRAGEISALRVCDIGENVIHIRHAWNEQDGLKPTKNYLCRNVPVMPEVSKMLIEHAEESNCFSDLSFVFFSYKNEQKQPLLPSVFESGFYRALNKIGISDEQRIERNIVFHSWRHYYAKKLSEQMKIEQAQQALGHLTPEMTQHYADHQQKQDFDLLEKAMTDTYNHILKFPEQVSTENDCKVLA
jgi:integrase